MVHELELVNGVTGLPAGPEEYAACVLRAKEIVSSPQSSPEQIEWALNFPEVDVMFWESTRERQVVDLVVI